MKQSVTVFLLVFSLNASAQNVGIGENNPIESRLQVKAADSAVLLLQNQATAVNSKTALYYKNDANYSGGIATIQTAPSFYRMGLFTFGGSSSAALKERLSILDGGNVGIGTTTPAAKLEVAGTVKIADGTQGAGRVLTSDAAGNASWSSFGSQFGYKKCIQLAPVFGGTFSGNFIVPAGVTEIMVEAWGAGSGGTVVSNVQNSFGGTSGGYARTVQTVLPGQSCSYTIGQGSADQFASTAVADGGSTTFNFAGTGIAAFGGGGRSANTIQAGAVKSGTGTVNNLYVMYGNTGDLPTVDYKQKSSTVFVEIRKFGSGGVTPAIAGAPMPKGGYQYLENNVQTYLINDNLSVTMFPGSGGMSLFSGATAGGGNGMIIIWYN